MVPPVPSDELVVESANTHEPGAKRVSADAKASNFLFALVIVVSLKIIGIRPIFFMSDTASPSWVTETGGGEVLDGGCNL
jgi:hypothetical protein